ncbi:MAG: DUF2062 domain-containing protein [Nitrospirae bacterium YQR-1]
MYILKIRNAFKQLLGLDDPPFLIALSFGIGALIGFSPLFGIHTPLALILAWAFKLNKVSIITGVYLLNPLTMVPIYTFGTWVGIKVLRSDASVANLNFKHVTLSNIGETFGALFWPFFVGNTITSIIGGVLSFLILFYIIKLRSRLKPIEANTLPHNQ